MEFQKFTRISNTTVYITFKHTLPLVTLLDLHGFYAH